MSVSKIRGRNHDGHGVLAAKTRTPERWLSRILAVILIVALWAGGGAPVPTAQGATLSGDAIWVHSFYTAYWNRAADPEGFQYWTQQIQKKVLDAVGVAENFALSEEAKGIYAYFKNPGAATVGDVTAFVQAVYRNLFNLNVGPQDSGVRYWVNVLRTGQSTPGAVIGHIINAARAENGQNWNTIWNKVQVSQYYVERFQQTGQLWTSQIHRNQALLIISSVNFDETSVTYAKDLINSVLGHSSITSNEEALKAIVRMASAQASLYADLLNLFSDNGTKLLFSPNLQFQNAYYEEMGKGIEKVLEAKKAYDEALIYLNTPNQAVSGAKNLVVENSGILSSVKNFFYNWAWGSAVKARERILNNLQNMSPQEQQSAYNDLKDRWGDKVGSSPQELVQNLEQGKLDGAAHQMHNELITFNEGYQNAADKSGKDQRPVKIAHEEGAKGLEAGVDVVKSVSTTVIGTKLPEFSDGFEKAENTINKINQIYEKDYQGLATDLAKDALKDHAKTFLKDKIGLDDFSAGEVADVIADEVEKEAKVTLATAHTSISDLLDKIKEFGLSYVTPAFKDGFDVEKILNLLGIPKDPNLPLSIAVLSGDDSKQIFPVSPGEYDITVVGDDYTSEVLDVDLKPGEGTVIPTDPGNQTSLDYVLSVSASPAQPAAYQGVTVTAKVSPATQGLTVRFSIVGTDGYQKQQTSLTDTSGVAVFYIPGGKPGVVDTVTVVLQETGQVITFTYSFHSTD